MRAARVKRLLALLLLGACACAEAAQVETLFHSAQERARLDRLRRGEPVVSGETVAVAAEPARRKELTGYVKRSDGRGTAFIDGAPVPVEKDAAPLLQPGSVRGYAGRQSEDLKIEAKPSR